MAGLNDDVDEGLPALEEDVVDVNEQTDIIDIPTSNPSQPEPEPIILIANDTADELGFREPSTVDLFGLGVIAGEVPNFKGEFEIIRQTRDSLVDFEEVSKNIHSKRSISQEDARLLDAIIPGFISEDRLLQYYTKEDSQTYLEESKVVMDNIIKSKKLEIDERLKNHIDNLINRYNHLIVLYKTEFQDKLTQQSNEIKNLLENVVIFNDNVFHKYFKEDIIFGDVISSPINDLNTELLTDRQQVRDLINELKKCYNDVNLKSYLISFRYNSSGSLVFVNNRSDDIHNGINLSEVFKIYRGDVQNELSPKIYLRLTENETELNNLRNKAIIFHRRENDNTKEDVVDTENIVMTLTHEYNYLLNLTLSLAKFNNCIINFISIFK